MSVEDFTTYTEVDGGDDITVTSNKCDIDDLESDVTSYVYKDKDSGHFGDFEHLIEVYIDSATELSSLNCSLYMVGNYVGDFGTYDTNNYDCMMLHAYNVGGTGYLRLFDTSTDNNDTGAVSMGTLYYLTIERASTTGTCIIYDDEDRTSEVDTLSFTVTDTTFQYIFAVNGHNSGFANLAFTGYCQDLDLQEPGLVEKRKGGLFGLRPSVRVNMIGG